MTAPPRIALAFIFKDDESTIEAMLASALPFVDEVVATDTGSTDGTRRIVKKTLKAWSLAQPGAHYELVDYEWTDDFAAARQAGWDKVTADWAIWVDADDILDGAQAIRQLAGESPPNIHAFVMDYDYAQTPQGVNVCMLKRERLIRHPQQWKWASPVHEVLIPQFQPCNFAYTPSPIYRHRKQPKPDEGERNLRIIEKHFADSLADGITPDPRMAVYRGTELASRGRHEEALKAYDYYFTLSGWGEEKHQTYHKKADSLRALGRFDEALEVDAYAMTHASEHGVAEWPDHPHGIGESLLGKSDYAGAVRWFERALEIPEPQTNLILNPRDYDWTPHANLALCYSNLADYAKALEHGQKAWSIMQTPELQGLMVGTMRADRVKQAADAAVGLIENLIRYDENQKALAVLPLLPYAVLADPRIQQLRHHLYVSLRHVRGKRQYGKLYETNREVRNPDEMVADASMRLVRVTELAQGIREQRGLERVDLSPFAPAPGDTEENARAKVAAGVEALSEEDIQSGGFLLLDAGCNDAWVGAHVESVLGLAVADGIDLNAKAIEAARDRSDEYDLNGQYEEGFVEDAADTFGEGRYDAISMFEVFEHVVDTHASLEQLERALKPGGRIYLSTPVGAYEAGMIDNWSENWEKQHLRAVTPTQFARFGLQRGHLTSMAMGADGTQVISYEPAPKKGRIVFYAGQGWEPWSPLDIRERGLGGSETAIAQMANELAERGWFVEVYAGLTVEGPIQQVLYRQHYEYDPEEHCDVFVSVRSPQAADWAPNADLTVLWCHDAHMGGELRPRLEGFDEILALSQDHADSLLEAEGVTNARMTRNGIDLSRWPEGDREFGERETTVIYSSSPDRGLEKLLDLWPAIKEAVPKAELKVFYGFDVFDKMNAANPPMQDWKKRLLARIEALDGAEFCGRVDQHALAIEQQNARVWAYPYPYESHTETSCITAMEAMAAGMTIVTTSSGALPETLGGVGTALEGTNASFPADEFVEAIVDGLTDPVIFTTNLLEGRERAATLSWRGVADEWDSWFSSILSTV